MTEGGFGKIYVLLKSSPTHSEGELSSVSVGLLQNGKQLQDG